MNETDFGHHLEPESLKRLRACEEAIGYDFQDLSLLQTALTHTSVAATRLGSNERLEFLGDAVLGCVIVDSLYHQRQSEMEGALTQMKSTIVSRVACARVSQALGLERFLALGKGMERRKIPQSLLANMQESIIGALYLDGGMDAARNYILRVFDEEIKNAIQGVTLKNFKMELQHFVQRKFHRTPEYETLDQKGPDHRKCFKVQVKVGDKTFHPAWGKNKKEAEQHAAENAMRQFENQSPIYPAD